MFLLFMSEALASVRSDGNVDRAGHMRAKSAAGSQALCIAVRLCGGKTQGSGELEHRRSFEGSKNDEEKRRS